MGWSCEMIDDPCPDMLGALFGECWMHLDILEIERTISSYVLCISNGVTVR